MMPTSARPWLSLTVLTVLLAAYGVLALGSGLDRAGATVNTLAPLTVFRGSELRANAARAIEESDFALGERLAGQSVAVNPSDTEALGLLATAHLANGDRDKATRIFGIAGQRGWRDLPTQLFWFDNAVRAQDWPVAAQRIDAVLRVRPSLAEMGSLLAALELSGPKARAALADRVALRSSWQRRYLDGLSGLTAQQVRARGQVLANARMAQANLTCGQVAPMVGALLEQGDRPLADRVWEQHCDKQGLAESVLDAEFRLLKREGELPGLGWVVEPSGDLNVDIGSEAAAAGVSVENVGVNHTLALSQKSLLKAGNYRISAVDEAGAEMPSIHIALTCSGRKELPQSAFSERAQSIVFVAPDCADQTLSVWVAPNSGRQAIARLKVTPLP